MKIWITRKMSNKVVVYNIALKLHLEGDYSDNKVRLAVEYINAILQENVPEAKLILDREKIEADVNRD